MRRSLSVAPGTAAALFVDLQEEHRQDKRHLVEGFDALLAKVRDLQAAARRHAVPVVHAAYVVDSAAGKPRPFHPMLADGRSAFSDKDDPLSAICPDVGPIGDETVVVKTEASAFGGGELARRLGAFGVEWLFVAGVWTEACIAATVKDAIDLGYRVVLIKDACGSGSAAMHQTGILNLANRLYGGAVVDSEHACRLMAGEVVDAWMVEGSVPFRFTYETAAGLYEDL
ncbi:MAG TPA: isochorismatase family protein [Lichenihabitans sp.]|nr:isochorismatase family protein [Lichenihabitans sp.]